MAIKESLFKGLNYARHHIFGTIIISACVWLMFVSEHSILAIHMLNRQKAIMQDQITSYRDSIMHFQESIDEVSGDREDMEHYAREKLMMKRANEDVYLIDE
ncbi:MAG: septum formation initiator family protein [Bacteroidales bacterium]|nr:septum formation initiator family protein [Candidatus Liminaster caballi]